MENYTIRSVRHNTEIDAAFGDLHFGAQRATAWAQSRDFDSSCARLARTLHSVFNRHNVAHYHTRRRRQLVSLAASDSLRSDPRALAERVKISQRRRRASIFARLRQRRILMFSSSYQVLLLSLSSVLFTSLCPPSAGKEIDFFQSDQIPIIIPHQVPPPTWSHTPNSVTVN